VANRADRLTGGERVGAEGARHSACELEPQIAVRAVCVELLQRMIQEVESGRVAAAQEQKAEFYRLKAEQANQAMMSLHPDLPEPATAP
jgi:hypothetical protein